MYRATLRRVIKGKIGRRTCEVVLSVHARNYLRQKRQGIDCIHRGDLKLCATGPVSLVSSRGTGPKTAEISANCDFYNLYNDEGEGNDEVAAERHEPNLALSGHDWCLQLG